jgi:D-alanyl-D-alanine carboxypeptidase (penicillin-binding protein 5/6)
LKLWALDFKPKYQKSTESAVGCLTRVHVVKKLTSVLNLTLKITMKPMNWLLTGLLLLLSAGQPTTAAAAAKTAKSTAASPADKSARSKSISRDPWLGAIVLDAATGKVLYEDQADTKGYPASVLKLMDLLIILEKIEQKQLSLADQVPVSAKASHTGGSRVWLADKESFTVDEMLYALMIQSANDAAVALAEKVAGSTDAFIELMNRRAKELGMNSTVFHSVHGLPPGKGQEHDVTTARDLSILCREVLKHRDTLRYTSTRERPFRPNVAGKTVIMRTHNHLLGHVEGCDGFKTGYIMASGFSIAVTAARHGQRVIAIVFDSTTLKVRDAKAAELLAKGFAALSAAAQGSAPPASRPTAAPVAGRKK